jgi:hypothetical protein
VICNTRPKAPTLTRTASTVLELGARRRRLVGRINEQEVVRSLKDARALHAAGLQDSDSDDDDDRLKGKDKQNSYLQEKKL